jgi:predicted transcriptional regulator
MENLTDDLMVKVKAISQGSNADLFRKLVDILYEREEEYFSPEDLAAIEEGIKEFERGEYITLEEYKKERGL